MTNRFAPAELATEILSCVRKAQANLAGQARDRFGGTAFGERIAERFEQRYPVPPEPEERLMNVGKLADEPVRVPRRPAPVSEEDEGFGGSVFTRGAR